MLSSIRNKIIVGVLVLILSIQIISTILQSYQVSNIFKEEFILGTQNLAQSVFVDLKSRVQSDFEYAGEEINKDEAREKLTLFIVINQGKSFEGMLKSKADLLDVQFLDDRGVLTVMSRKTEGKIEHLNLMNNPEIKADTTAIELAKNQELGSMMADNRIVVFIPLIIKDVHQGGLALTYSDYRLNKTKNDIYISGGVLVTIFMLLSTLLVILFVKYIVTLPIRDMIRLMGKLADGDLGQQFESKKQDEIGKMGDSVNELLTSLRSVFESIDDVMGGVEQGDLSREITIDLKGDLERIKSRINQSIQMLGDTVFTVKETTQSVEQSARELSDSAAQLSSSSSEQAATIEEVSSAVAQIESHSKQNSEHANEAKKTTDETLTLVNRGSQQMDEMQTSMDEINDTSRDVTKIIKVIDEIAFQTNLLALNAAVEAARAGKYGKGFSVVAEEVRNLAARSAEAARTTSDLIESSNKQVENGVEIANQTNDILKEIVTEVQKSNELVTLITEASKEQTVGISEIYTGISQVNDAVQQNSAIAEETASSSEVLLNQSTSLQQAIHRFKLSNLQYNNTQPEPELHPLPQITQGFVTD